MCFVQVYDENFVFTAPGFVSGERSGLWLSSVRICGCDGDQPHPVAEGGGRFMKKTLFINACVRPEYAGRGRWRSMPWIAWAER